MLAFTRNVYGRFAMHSCVARMSAYSRMMSSGDPPVQAGQRAQYGLKENEIGSRWKWVLQALGFFSKESINIRNSAMLYLNARDQAARPEFYRTLGPLLSLQVMFYFLLL